MTNRKEVHIPYLSQEEQIFLNTAATFSQYRRMSNQSLERSSIENSHHNSIKRHQVISMSSLSSFLFKRRSSSTSSLVSSSSSTTTDFVPCQSEYEYLVEQSPKARELESLIFEQPQRTVRLSLTPRCAV